MKVYNKSYKQEIQEDNTQAADGESSDEEDWMVHVDEDNWLMDDLGQQSLHSQKLCTQVVCV